MSSLHTHENRRSLLLLFVSTLVFSIGSSVEAFATAPYLSHLPHLQRSTILSRSIPTALNVWWFGGAESSEANLDDESCELVAVRIDRTSPNSRRIAGSITVPTPMDDVWAILTDYDRLAVHVPNLVESKVVSRPSTGEQGDGSYRCKLFQKGAQKIVGFEFGASVTMEMTEKILVEAASEGLSAGRLRQERMIGFKCVDSFFFTEFDGDWKAREFVSESGVVETELTYVVDVRPKGPVPVAALEWRIREDVPTNLRAVKKAAMEVGMEGVNAFRKSSSARFLPSRNAARIGTPTNGQVQTNGIRRATVRLATGSDPVPVRTKSSGVLEQPIIATRRASRVKKAMPGAAAVKPRGNILQAAGRKTQATTQAIKRAPLPFKVTWEADETMAAYLRE